MENTNPRAMAHWLLLRSEQSGTYSNIALDKLLSTSEMSKKDKSLCAVLFYGVIERKLTLDYYIKKYSSRPLKEVDTSTLCALRMGFYQLVFLDKIPPHAAINEAVELCTKKTRGFVNAILRSYLRAPELSLPKKEEGMAEHLSVKLSVCLPLAERLISVFGENEAEAFLEACGNAPPTTLRTNTLKISRDALSSNIEGASLSKLSPHGIYASGAVRELYGFDEGLFFVQDDASQLCVEAVGAKRGDRVLDICSCPGSKSFGMAMSMENEGEIFSFDIHENKLSLVRGSAARLGIDIISTRAADGRIKLEDFIESADCVLCDVPCSGFGVLSKKGELRYKDPAESERLPDIQLAILENASGYVKVGGTLVYSTCTVLPEENEENVKRFLSSHSEFSLCPFEAGALSCERGYMTLLPHIHGTDGFFISKFKRNI